MLNAKNFFGTKLKVSSACTRAGDTYNNSLHFQLSIHLAAREQFFPSSAARMRCLPMHSWGRTSRLRHALYPSPVHCWFPDVRAFAHAGIFWVRIDPEQNKGNVLDRVLNKEAIISHLSWVSLFLGFHTWFVCPQRCRWFRLWKNKI